MVDPKGFDVSEIRYEELSKKHDREGFSSGNDRIDNWLKKTARQSATRGDSITFVAVRDNPDQSKTKPEILGYVTMVPGAEYREGSAPAELLGVEGRDAKGFLVAQMGVDEKYAGKGLGSALLASAMHRAKGMGQQIDGMTIDPQDNQEHLRKLYGNAQFESSPTVDQADKESWTMAIKRDDIGPALDKMAAKQHVVDLGGWRAAHQAKTAATAEVTQEAKTEQAGPSIVRKL